MRLVASVKSFVGIFEAFRLGAHSFRRCSLPLFAPLAVSVSDGFEAEATSPGLPAAVPSAERRRPPKQSQGSCAGMWHRECCPATTSGTARTAVKGR